MTTTSSRNIAASIANSRVKDVGRLDVSTRCPPMSPPTPSPRFCRKNCMAKARDRVSAVEQSTIIVASAGCITACPAPSAAADSSTVVALPASPRLSAPTRGGDQGGEQHRQRAAPDDGPPGERQHDERGHGEDGEHEPRRHGTQTPHLRHIDVQVRDGEAEPERAECVAHLDPAHRCAHRPGHFHLPCRGLRP